MKEIDIPRGFQWAGCHCGVKQNAKAEDVALVVSAAPCVAAGVYTRNQVVAAPVLIDRERTPTADFRALIVNSGNANACTGKEGMSNARDMSRLTAEATGCEERQVLVMSTGIIGQQLPMNKISQGIAAAAERLAADHGSVEAFARGMLTTDTRTKLATRSVRLGDQPIRLLGVAKGSGMIGPNMATMLATVLTDASLQPSIAQELLGSAAAKSFNSISVDGHTSTNDSLLLLASGRQPPLEGDRLGTFEDALNEICVDLARQIVDDGEGASHLMEIVVTGADSETDAHRIAQSIANSPLVKTALAGNDPNWGRIVSAAGYAQARIDTARLCLRMNDALLFADGVPVFFDAEATSKRMAANREVLIELAVGDGPGSARFWTCDLTHEYVTINADYHT